jgi:hypothetical protein
MNWSMSFIEALEAEVKATLAEDFSWFQRWVLDSIVAARRRTPLGSLIDINE